MEAPMLMRAGAAPAPSQYPVHFRSQGEAQIGRCLARHDIDYFYEHPLAVLDRGKLRIWYPDFQLQPYSLVLEYGGRLDDPDYAAGWRHKQRVYAANSIDALMLTPADLAGDWPTRLLGRIEQTLEARLKHFRAVCHDSARQHVLDNA